MRRVLLLLMTMVLCYPLFCQNEKQRNLRVNWDYCFYTRELYGIPFHSLKSYTYEEWVAIKDLPIICDKTKMYFTLNDLSISEDDYFHLFLRTCEVDSERCYYVEEYESDSISRINYHAYVTIPLVIDGTEYRYEDAIPIKDLQGKRLNFKKQERFLRKNRIIIESE